MSRRSPFVIVLSAQDRSVLESTVRRRRAEQRMVIRAQIVLAAADGVDNYVIADRLQVAVNTVILWRKRFFEHGMAGLVDRHRSGRPRTFPPSGECRDQRVGVRTPGDDGGAIIALELRRARP